MAETPLLIKAEELGVMAVCTRYLLFSLLIAGSLIYKGENQLALAHGRKEWCVKQCFLTVQSAMEHTVPLKTTRAQYLLR